MLGMNGIRTHVNPASCHRAISYKRLGDTAEFPSFLRRGGGLKSNEVLFNVISILLFQVVCKCLNVSL